jgi:hypothetical protein
MILMRIVAPVGQNHIGRRPLFQCLEPIFDVSSLVWEETVFELCQIDDRPRGIR